MKRGEVWWVEFDPSVGSEIRKTRPAVIVSNDSANRNLLRVVVIPITSNTGRQYPGEALVTLADKKQGKAMADQIMAADKSRLKNKLCTLSKADMLAVENAILETPQNQRAALPNQAVSKGIGLDKNGIKRKPCVPGANRCLAGPSSQFGRKNNSRETTRKSSGNCV